MSRPTLSIKKKDPAEAIALSLQIGKRYVDRKGRYIQQVYVRLEESTDHTWVDIPLVPEVYGAKA
jgi:hypothetical protein